MSADFKDKVFDSFTSAESSVTNKIQGTGMNAHVSKPVEMKVLEKTIRSIKSGGGGTEVQVIEE